MDALDRWFFGTITLIVLTMFAMLALAGYQEGLNVRACYDALARGADLVCDGR